MMRTPSKSCENGVDDSTPLNSESADGLTREPSCVPCIHRKRSRDEDDESKEEGEISPASPVDKMQPKRLVYDAAEEAVICEEPVSMTQQDTVTTPTTNSIEALVEEGEFL